MDDAAVPSERPSVEIDDVARRFGLWTQPLDQSGIVAVGHEADVLAVGLGRDHQPELGRDPPHLVLRQVAEREAQELELLARRTVKEVALVAARIGALVELNPPVVHDPPDVMAGGEAVGAKLPREADQIDELHALVAARARHGRATAGIFVDEAVDHAAPEAACVIEHVMGDAEPVGDLLRIIDVLPGAACARAAHRFAVIVELERHSNDLGARPGGERGRDGAVDAARHGDDDPGLTCGAA